MRIQLALVAVLLPTITFAQAQAPAPRSRAMFTEPRPAELITQAAIVVGTMTLAEFRHAGGLMLTITVQEQQPHHPRDAGIGGRWDREAGNGFADTTDG